MSERTTGLHYAPAPAAPAMELVKVQRTYDQAGERLEILRGCDLALAQGQSVA
ncbi:MAG: ABC transporter, partial [Alphaproteobacteria bacterium]|nr:ABC transporter [Alphaproteobacteria bacterium]